ncbi:MAG: hypothetical protein U0529_14420 [Thermoanaerobaculia bacterium]
MTADSNAKSQGLPSWVTELFNQFLNHHDDLARVLHLSINGISMLRGRYTALKVLTEVDGPTETSAAQLARAEKERELAQSELDDDFPLLHEQATVALWASLEALVRSFVAGWLANRPDAWQADAVKRLKVRLGDYEALETADRCLWVTDLLDQDIGGPLRAGITRFESLLAPFSLNGTVEPETQKTLFELSQIRHNIIHRRGLADRRLLEACPWLGLVAGARVRVSHKMWRGFNDATAAYALELIQRSREAHGLGRYVHQEPPPTPP